MSKLHYFLNVFLDFSSMYDEVIASAVKKKKEEKENCKSIYVYVKNSLNLFFFFLFSVE